MKLKPLLLFTLALLAAPAGADSGVDSAFRAEDIFALGRAVDLQVRPDGKAIAYVRLTNDIQTDRARPAIWVADPATGMDRPLTSDENANSSPRWSPDGSRIAFLSSSPSGTTEIVVQIIASGEKSRIAPGLPAVVDLRWSPDGNSLAFTAIAAEPRSTLARGLTKPVGAKWAEPLEAIEQEHYRADGRGYLQPGHRHIFVVAPMGGPARQVTSGDFDVIGPISFADNGSILFAANRRDAREQVPGRSNIYRVAIGTGQIAALTRGSGSWASPTASPDGRWIAYLGHAESHRNYENNDLYLMKRDGSGMRLLTAGFDRSVADLEWARDSRGVYARYIDRGIGKVARIGIDGRITTVVTRLANAVSLDRPYAGGAYSVGGPLIAFTTGDAQHPSDVAVLNNGHVKQLTAINRDLLNRRRLGRVEALPVTSSLDKLPIGAWIVTPPDFDPDRKYPLILEIHGGPQEAYGPSFATDVQIYATAGYVVVYGNPRGSTSYGAAFANNGSREFPGSSFDDLMSMVDAAIAKGFIDPHKLFVTGGSAGGALTAWIVGKTHRFAAAAAQKPVIDWISEVLTTDDTVGMIHGFYDKAPWEDPIGYWNHSPLSLVPNVTTPTMVIVGEQDFRTPPGQSEELYQALRAGGVPAALVRVPGASHDGLAGRPSQAAAKALTILRWFARYGGPSVP